MQDVQNAVNATELPEGAGEIDFEEVNSYDLRQVVEVAIYGICRQRHSTTPPTAFNASCFGSTASTR